MKQLTTLLLFFLSINLSYSQGAGLTKEETVKYINKKLKEVEGYKTSWSNDATAYILENKMESLGDGKYNYINYYSNGENYCTSDKTSSSGSRFNNEFKAIHIKSMEEISEAKANKSIGRIRVTLHEKAVKWWARDFSLNSEDVYRKVFLYTDYWGNAQYTDEYSYTKYWCTNSDRDITYDGDFVLYYSKVDAEDGKKLLKALQYLVDLEKAEDDPFG